MEEETGLQLDILFVEKKYIWLNSTMILSDSIMIMSDLASNGLFESLICAMPIVTDLKTILVCFVAFLFSNMDSFLRIRIIL